MTAHDLMSQVTKESTNMSIQKNIAEAVREHNFFRLTMEYDINDTPEQRRSKEIDRAQLVVQILGTFLGVGTEYVRFNADDLRSFLRDCHFSAEVINLLVNDTDPFAIY